MPERLARADARSDARCRALVVALDVVPRAAGSAYVELGDTKVSCAVYGPRRARADLARVARGTLDVTATVAPFARRAATLDGTAREKARGREPTTADAGLAERVEEALLASVLAESFAKTQVDVCVTVLDANGGGGDGERAGGVRGVGARGGGDARLGERVRVRADGGEDIARSDARGGRTKRWESVFSANVVAGGVRDDGDVRAVERGRDANRVGRVRGGM